MAATNCTNMLWFHTLTDNQQRHLQLMSDLQNIKKQEESIRAQLRNSWLTMTAAEKVGIVPPPVDLVRGKG